MKFPVVSLRTKHKSFCQGAIVLKMDFFANIAVMVEFLMLIVNYRQSTSYLVNLLNYV